VLTTDSDDTWCVYGLALLTIAVIWRRVDQDTVLIVVAVGVVMVVVVVVVVVVVCQWSTESALLTS